MYMYVDTWFMSLFITCRNQASSIKQQWKEVKIHFSDLQRTNGPQWRTYLSTKQSHAAVEMARALITI